MAGKTSPAFPVHAQPAISRIWQEAHGEWNLARYCDTLRFPNAVIHNHYTGKWLLKQLRHLPFISIGSLILVESLGWFMVSSPKIECQRRLPKIIIGALTWQLLNWFLFFVTSSISMGLPITYHVDIWQFLLQRGCGDTFQMLTWFTILTCSFANKMSLSQKLTNEAAAIPYHIDHNESHIPNAVEKQCGSLKVFIWFYHDTLSMSRGVKRGDNSCVIISTINDTVFHMGILRPGGAEVTMETNTSNGSFANIRPNWAIIYMHLS